MKSLFVVHCFHPETGDIDFSNEVIAAENERDARDKAVLKVGTELNGRKLVVIGPLVSVN